MPTIEAWLQSAADDVTRRSKTDARPVLEALAQAVQVLRRADWNVDASRGEPAVRPQSWRTDRG